MQKILTCAAIFVIMTAFFAVTKAIETKALVRTEEGVWPCIRLALLFGALGLPLMPLLYWAIRAIYLMSGERLWAVPIVMMAWANITSGVIFWIVKEELPTGGTLVGLLLSAAAVAVSMLWR